MEIEAGVSIDSQYNKKKLTKEELSSLNHEQLVNLCLKLQESPKTKTRNQKKKEDRPLNWEKFSIRHIAFKVIYFGWKYQGLAYQKEIDNTVEHYLIQAFKKCKLIEDFSQCNWSRSGRTDKGVSAFCQVVSLYVRSNVKNGVGVIKAGSLLEDGKEEHDYLKMLNSTLPDDIKVISWTPVPSDFNARFSAMSRTYKYYFVKENLDIERMKIAAKDFIGEHDFRNFCKLDVKHVKTFVRSVKSISIDPVDDNRNSNEWSDLYVITITGSAFLWHQVRCMVSILFLIGQSKEDTSIVSELLDTTKFPKKPIYLMAPDIPLVLVECGYEDLNMKTDIKAISVLYQHFFNVWKEYRIKERMIKDTLNIIESAYKELEESKEGESIWNTSLKYKPLGHGTPKVYTPLRERETESSFEERQERFRTNKRLKVSEEKMIQVNSDLVDGNE